MTIPGPGRAEEEPGEGFVSPGGKVDPEALRRHADLARAADDDEPVPVVTFVVRRPPGSRLDRYLASRVTFLSRTRLQALIESGAARVNGRGAKSSTTVRPGDVVEVAIPVPEDPEVRPEPIPLDVLFEDEHIIVLNKSADVIVHPARMEHSGTLINALAWHFRHVSAGALSSVGRDMARPGVVHRLDRHTTGCIAFAKTDEAHWKLGRQFEDRLVRKRYLALAHGHVEPDADVVDLPIGPHPSRQKGYREKYVVRHDAPGRPSVTLWFVRERFTLAQPAAAPGRFSLVELDLRTGRTHQIRVHLSHAGYPIVGDEMYGGRAITIEDAGLRAGRPLLHAASLEFAHPVRGGPMSFLAPLPEPFRAALAHLRSRGRSLRASPPGAALDIDALTGAGPPGSPARSAPSAPA
jgi:23S rRNA pseudouridine1911/1915/1917 synthase